MVSENSPKLDSWPGAFRLLSGFVITRLRTFLLLFLYFQRLYYLI
jgi:hypothetical protein